MLEVLEQLRLLFIVVMAYLSYQHLTNAPLSITYSDDESDSEAEENSQLEDNGIAELDGNI
jgi:hypothetical protein